MTVFLGTLWTSIKQIKAPCLFDGEHGIALYAVQGKRASSHGEGGVSWFFSSCLLQNLGYILKLQRGWPFKTHVCSVASGLLSSYNGHLWNLHEAWQGNTDTFRSEAGDRESLFSCHPNIGIPINFQEESVILTFSNIELCVALEVSKGWQASCPHEAGMYGFL